MPYLLTTAPDPEPIDCRILSAALELFVEHGYHRVSVHDIQRCSDVSIGSIYKHFGGKEGVAKALYYHLLNELDQVVEQVNRDFDNARARCEEIIRLLLEYTESHRSIVAFILHPRHREFLPEEPPICSAAPFLKMRGMVEQGMAEGSIRPSDTWIASAAVFGGAIRMIQLRLDGTLNDPLPPLHGEIVAAAWRGVGS